MLRLLTDEQISPAVATHAQRRVRSLSLVALHEWQGGHFLGASDEMVLAEAHKHKLTLVTFDLRTIPPLLRVWAESGMDHSGVVLVDGRTLAQNNIGGLAAALCALWQEQRTLEWTNRVVYLTSKFGVRGCD